MADLSYVSPLSPGSLASVGLGYLDDSQPSGPGQANPPPVGPPTAAVDPYGFSGYAKGLIGGSGNIDSQSILSRQSELENASKTAAQKKMDRIQQAIDTLQAGRSNLPMLAFGQGMLAPTKTGAFSETLSNAIGNAMPAVKDERAFEQQMEQLGISKADVEAAQAAQAAKDFNDKVKTSLEATKAGVSASQEDAKQKLEQSKASSLDRYYKDTAANQRYNTEMAYAPDPDETERWAPAMDPKTKAQAVNEYGQPLWQAYSKYNKPVGEPSVVRQEDLDASAGKKNPSTDPDFAAYKGAGQMLDTLIAKRASVLNQNPHADTSILDTQIKNQQDVFDLYRKRVLTKGGVDPGAEPSPPGDLSFVSNGKLPPPQGMYNKPPMPSSWSADQNKTPQEQARSSGAYND